MLKQYLSQKLQQKLSPQQIQLMKLLQIPTATLEQRIQEELEANPALEEGDETAALMEGMASMEMADSDAEYFDREEKNGKEERADEDSGSLDDVDRDTADEYADEEEVVCPRDLLAAALEDSRRHDLARGTTTVGPHRDDFEVRLGDQPADNFASQGQARALVLAFKIAELQAAREQTGEAPLLLLDDVSSELDPKRSAQLFVALVREAGQCVLTTTAPHFIALDPGEDCRYIEVRGGGVQPACRARGGPAKTRVYPRTGPPCALGR